MRKVIIGSVFRGEWERKNLKFLQKELEGCVKRRKLIVGCKRFDFELDGVPVLMKIEFDAIRIIERMFEVLRPEAFQNARTMETRVIWELYWYERHTRRKNSSNTNLVSVLAQLDKKPIAVSL